MPACARHVFGPEVVAAGPPPSRAGLLGASPEGLTASERLRLGRELYPGITLQPELPPHWVLACLQAGLDPRRRFVWGFPAGCPHGLPLALSAEAEEALGRLEPHVAA